MLGPNGAGKSTLLELAAAGTHPGHRRGAGERLGAVDVFELRPRIGLASTTVGSRIPGRERVLDAVVTAAWAVTRPLARDYDPSDEQRARRLLDLLGVGHLAERRLDTLSEGERRRVLIARALMTDPGCCCSTSPRLAWTSAAGRDLVSRLGWIAQDPAAPTTVLVTTTWRDPRRLHPRAAAARRRHRGRRADR